TGSLLPTVLFTFPRFRFPSRSPSALPLRNVTRVQVEKPACAVLQTGFVITSKLEHLALARAEFLHHQHRRILFQHSHSPGTFYIAVAFGTLVSCRTPRAL